MAEIRSKAEYYELFERGVLGNRTQTWPSLKHLIWSNFRGNVTVRYKGVDSRFHQPNCTVPQAVAFCNSAIQQGAKWENFTFAEAPPDRVRIFQGEVMRSDRYLNLYYSTLALPMREALRREGQEVQGLRAVLLLRSNLDPADYDWLWELFDTYPDAVIELSTFLWSTGTLRRRTIFWEVRNY